VGDGSWIIFVGEAGFSKVEFTFEKKYLFKE